jgi:hypothetical protein
VGGQVDGGEGGKGWKGRWVGGWPCNPRLRTNGSQTIRARGLETNITRHLALRDTRCTAVHEPRHRQAILALLVAWGTRNNAGTKVSTDSRGFTNNAQTAHAAGTARAPLEAAAKAGVV